MALPSTLSSKDAAQATVLVENIRKILSPFSEKKKDDFAQILNLIHNLVNETPSVTPTGATSSSPLKLASSTTSTSNAPALSSNAKSSKIPDELAYGYARGQFAPGTNLPVRIKWEDPHYIVQPTDMPQWDGKTPPGVPSGSVPFYSDSGYLLWFGLNGKVYESSGSLRDNTWVNWLAARNNVSVETYLNTIQTAIRAAGRPATKNELYDMSVQSTGGQYATYEPVVTPEAERAAAALASLTSPFGYGVGQIVPGTGLPARLIPGGDATHLLTVDDMPQWDGRIPPHVPNGSVPFYSTNGSLMWLALNGVVYDSSGMTADNTVTTFWASRKQMSVSAYVAMVRSMAITAGRVLTLTEASSAELSA